MQGIEPDIVLPDPLGYLKSGEQYADYALAWDSVSKADFAPWKTKTGLLEALRADSQKRLVADPRYLSLVEQARRNEDRSQKSSYPLVLNSLRNEIQELKALREESAPDGGSSSERENPASWQAKLAGDFNVAEAVHVLGDLLLVNNNRSPGRAVAGTVTVP
jgi:carboxyl-terminal processing protease